MTPSRGRRSTSPKNSTAPSRRGCSVFYVLGDVLGSGIYALVGVMAGQVGGAFWVSFLVGVGAAMLTGSAYAELITRYPQSAGAALYVNRAFNNRFFTFLVTFATVAASLAASLAATGALAFGGYFLELLRALQLRLLPTAAAFILVLSFINFRGISESVQLNLAMSITELSGLALVLAIGAWVFLTGDADLVRRQMLWDRRGAELTEDLAHLGCEVRRHGCGAASGVAGWCAA